MDLDAQLLVDLLGLERWDLLGLDEPVQAAGRDHVDLDPEAGAWFVIGRTPLALVAVNPATVTVAEPRIDWDGPGTPVLRARDRTEYPNDGEHAELLGWSIRDTIEQRRARFATCSDCNEHLPPEHLGHIDGEVVCHGCMTANHGVVF